MIKADRVVLMRRVRIEPSGCWRWLGTITTGGYGQVQLQGRKYQAHRVFYFLDVGAIPSGKTLDHKCRHRWCVNPDHLEPVSNHANILRGIVPSANRELCKAGLHRIVSPDATFIDSEGNERCRQCRLESKRRYRERQRSV